MRCQVRKPATEKKFNSYKFKMKVNFKFLIIFVFICTCMYILTLFETDLCKISKLMYLKKINGHINDKSEIELDGRKYLSFFVASKSDTIEFFDVQSELYNSINIGDSVSKKCNSLIVDFSRSKEAFSYDLTLLNCNYKVIDSTFSPKIGSKYIKLNGCNCN